MEFSGLPGPILMTWTLQMALLSRTHRQMQEKINTVAENSERLGLRVHWDKSKVLENNAAASTTFITPEGDGLENVTSFTYLGSIC